ncbi:unnamed protein product, partial [marine sediment metagenome]
MLRGIGYENILNAEVKVITLPQGKDPDDVIKEDAKTWQKLLGEALPIVDYTFNMVTSSLDLTTARDKTLAVGKLLPIIAEIKDTVRQAHYLQKLARLVNVTERHLEAELRRIKPSPSRRQSEEPKQESIAQTLRSLWSSPVEEYCLALLFQHPALKSLSQQPSPEYFQNSENRAIFSAWQQASDLSSLKDKLDPAIWEHLDYLLSYLKKRGVPTNQIEARYVNCVLRLREEFLRNLEVKRGAALALEAELGGNTAELAKLEELGIEVS